MNLKSLRVLVHFIQDGTLARAADRLNFSEPAASRLLKQLEADLGIALFDRRGRRMLPTSVARVLYPEAVRILTAVDGLPGFIDQIQEEAAPLKILCHPRLAYGLVYPAMKLFTLKRPETRIHLEVHSKNDLGRFLAEEVFDFGFSSLPVPLHKLEPKVTYESHLHVMVRSDHPLAERAFVKVADLHPYPFISLTKETQMRKHAEDCMLRAGERLRIFHEVSTSDAAHYLVSIGMGFTITDLFSSGSAGREKFRFLPLLPETTIRFGIFYHDGHRDNPAAMDFLECAGAVVKSILQLISEQG